MTRAKPYPKTDAAEQDAVNIFLSLIDTRFVKADIRTRDKYPNVDGTLELVGEDQVPLGKFEVQIRKVATRQKRYSCPETLVAYSQVSTLPVVLICNAIALELPKDKRNFITFDMDWLARYLSHNTVTPISHAHSFIAFALESSRVSIKSAFEALRYLSAPGVSTIKRFWIRQSRPLSPGDNWIWSGYTRETEIHNVRVVLERSLEEYKTFIKGNHLRLDNSTYLDPYTSIIYEYEPSFAREPWQCPIINEHHVENAQFRLPKVLVRITTGKRGRIDLQRFPTVQVDGYNYKAVASSRYLADFLFQRTPVRNMLYELLRRDLEAHYNIR